METARNASPSVQRGPEPPGASGYEPLAPIGDIPSLRAQLTHPRRAKRGGATMALQGRAS
jgi:hypothetical protein